MGYDTYQMPRQELSTCFPGFRISTLTPMLILFNYKTLVLHPVALVDGFVYVV
jgi:hypothetical protein